MIHDAFWSYYSGYWCAVMVSRCEVLGVINSALLGEKVLRQ